MTDDDVTMGYEADELQRGAAEQADVVEAADGLARMLADLHLDTVAMGSVGSAAAFAQAVDAAQQSQAGGAAASGRSDPA